MNIFSFGGAQVKTAPVKDATEAVSGRACLSFKLDSPSMFAVSM